MIAAREGLSTAGSVKLAGQPREREVSGFADPHCRFSRNLYGAPALKLEDLAGYEQDLIVGASLDVSAPLGQYDASKLLNIGTSRWSVTPELGKAFGRVTLEASAAARQPGRNFGPSISPSGAVVGMPTFE